MEKFSNCDELRLRHHQRRFLQAIYEFRRIKWDQRKLQERGNLLLDFGKLHNDMHETLWEMHRTQNQFITQMNLLTEKIVELQFALKQQQHQQQQYQQQQCQYQQYQQQQYQQQQHQYEQQQQQYQQQQQQQQQQSSSYQQLDEHHQISSIDDVEFKQPALIMASSSMLPSSEGNINCLESSLPVESIIASTDVIDVDIPSSSDAQWIHSDNEYVRL
ncbi:unnamed protein product [Wuchereria bancrofti]|uniref:Calmodulin-binding domain-containing protein n=1 Tax=Wuchereria bancrofti TaxID=6293 RepID=A0A3P7EKV3_WUCBA|nr:unnamed protein product [Wuchereria bancrofti]